MNRIFKVVFNQILGHQVVVSELVSSVQRGICKTVVVVALTFVTGHAWAVDSVAATTNSRIENNGTLSTGSYAYGSSASGRASNGNIIANNYGSSASGHAVSGKSSLITMVPVLRAMRTLETS